MSRYNIVISDAYACINYLKQMMHPFCILPIIASETLYLSCLFAKLI